MSFLKKTLASFGIGSAKVDSVLQQEVLYPGQTVDVVIHVYGGASEQVIDNIHLKLCCHYFAENESESNKNGPRSVQTYTLTQWLLPESFVIKPGEERQFEVTLIVPLNTPVTLATTKVWLETGFDKEMSPTETNAVTVRPDLLMDGILSELEGQGLRIRQVECEQVSGFDYPFVQEYEFVPIDGPFHGRWRELEVVAWRDDNALQLWFAIDRNHHGNQGMFASLLGTGPLEQQLVIPANLSEKQAGDEVMRYLENIS